MFSNSKITHDAWNCGFELYVAHNPPKVPNAQRLRFWGLQNSVCRNLERFQAGYHRHIDSRLLFQKRSKSVQDKWPKGCAVFLPCPKYTCLCLLGKPLGVISPIFCVILHCRFSLIFRVLSQSVQVWVKKSFSGLPKQLQRPNRLFEHIGIRDRICYSEATSSQHRLPSKNKKSKSAVYLGTHCNIGSNSAC